ncbi:MAG: HNH endonuclease [Verrucomicrobiota bacterium]
MPVTAANIAECPQSGTILPHEQDHIQAQKHHGPTTLENLCWSCAQCNGAKGANVAGYDPDTGQLTALFNPRSQDWSDHFVWEGAVLIGKTPEGRTTVDVLSINWPERVEHRELLVEAGVFS